MIRPCFLVVDKEHAVSISTRKLVIETAKLNVITAYSSQEAIETLQVFPAVHGAVLEGSMRDMPCTELIASLRSIKPDLPIIVIGGAYEGGSVNHVDHFDPQTLVAVLKKLRPEEARAIERHEAKLMEES
jgi:response regulator RpfG family c-di-GMP phosphodiesterase